MPYYPSLRNEPEDVRVRTASNLLLLRQSLRSEIPERTSDDTLLLATWNIREFGRDRIGKRLTESYFYIAEVLSAFDLIAVQEVARDLSALRKVMEILGPSWAYFAADISSGMKIDWSRLVFLYDTRKVKFRNTAGQIVLSQDELILDEFQFARPPYLTSFQSGWFDFYLCAVHIYFGSNHGAKLQRRIGEIDRISQIMARRAKMEDANMIMLGDFNILNPQHDTMMALTKHGFFVPDELLTPSNISGTRFYSQIAFVVKENQLQLGTSTPPAGVFNFFDVVFRIDDQEIYRELWERPGNGYKKSDEENRRDYERWRMFQMSDHFPLWVELRIDFAEEYLKILRK